MANFTADKTRMDFVHRKHKFKLPETQTLTVTGVPDPEDSITLTKVGGATWLTIPATCEHTEAFNVSIAAAGMPSDASADVATRTETIRASYGGYDNLDIPVTMKIGSEGKP